MCRRTMSGAGAKQAPYLVYLPGDTIYDDWPPTTQLLPG